MPDKFTQPANRTFAILVIARRIAGRRSSCLPVRQTETGSGMVRLRIRLRYQGRSAGVLANSRWIRPPLAVGIDFKGSLKPLGGGFNLLCNSPRLILPPPSAGGRMVECGCRKENLLNAPARQHFRSSGFLSRRDGYRRWVRDRFRRGIEYRHKFAWRHLNDCWWVDLLVRFNKNLFAM